MLEEQDFKKIGQVIEEKIEANNIKIGEEVGKVIEQNVTPVLDSLDKRVDSLDKRLARVESNMVTKDDLNRGLADLKGNIILKLREEDKKINLLIELLRERKVLKEEDVQILKQIEVFPQL